MATTYLTRTPSSNGTSGTTFTFSAWVKRSGIANIPRIFEFYNNTSNYISLRFRDDGSNASKLQFYSESGGSGYQLTTAQSFRDLNAYYHFVMVVDTTESTDTNRLKLYVNGSRVTEFGSGGYANIYPSLNHNMNFNNSGNVQYIGRKWENSDYFDGLMTHIHFIDGTAYQASTFGETDATTGIWKPKTAPSVTYGTNGFFLKGENSSALGTDSSGRGNNFTVNGTPTQTIDTPSNVFATGNPLYKWSYNQTQTNGNTSFAGTQNQWQGASSTLGISKGKYYFEVKITNDNGLSNGSSAMLIGFMGLDDYNISNPSRNLVALYSYDGGEIFVADATNSTATTADYGTFATNDIMGVALDYDNELISFYKNGSAIATNFDYGAVATSDTLKDGKTITPVFVSYGTNAVSANFGNGFFGTTAVASATTDASGLGIFEYTVPSGYYALCTKNINAQEYS